MAQPVTIESDALRAEVWPQFGGKVSSVVDKADGYDLMFTYPAELPTGPQYDLPYGKGWYAGWDECFPAIAASKYVGRPYDAIPVPDQPTMALSFIRAMCSTVMIAVLPVAVTKMSAVPITSSRVRTW